MKQTLSVIFSKKSVLTIPNLMSLVRLILIVPIVWSLVEAEQPRLTAALLLFSGATDVADGWVARHFQMISPLGKALDPIADKLTQFSVLVCLALRVPTLWLPLVLLMIKEVVSGLMSLRAIGRTGEVQGAEWHGKVVTCLIYTLMFAHILWKDMPGTLSNILIGLCVAMMVASFALYARRNIRILRGGKPHE